MAPKPLPEVPSRWGRRLLAFEFLVLVEYWVAPLFLGITNYAGLWSDIGSVLFVGLASSLVVVIVWPLRVHLRESLTGVRRRALFHAIWIGSFVIGLFTTNILQFVDGPASGPVLFGQTTIYTPLGAWPSLTIYLPVGQIWATLNIEGPTVLFLLSFLSAAAIVLGSFRPATACPLPKSAGPGRARRAAPVGILAPLGFITSCPGCSPLYFALLALIVPGTLPGATQVIPLVPWIGLAGLVFLFGFWLAIRLISASTRPPDRTALDAAVPGGGHGW